LATGALVGVTIGWLAGHGGAALGASGGAILGGAGAFVSGYFFTDDVLTAVKGGFVVGALGGVVGGGAGGAVGVQLAANAKRAAVLIQQTKALWEWADQMDDVGFWPK
jgi:hypothetical protein